MPNDFERLAVQRLIDKATALGVDIPREIAEIVCGDQRNIGAMLWAKANPDDDELRGCCWGDVNGGADSCNCWVPVFNVDQADPVMPASTADFEVQRRVCGDCAYRKDSPERADGPWCAVPYGRPAGAVVRWVGCARGEVGVIENCAPCWSGTCQERRDSLTGECMALKRGREYLAQQSAEIDARRDARTGGQLSLFDLAGGAR